VFKQYAKAMVNGGRIKLGRCVQVCYFAVIASHDPINIDDDTLIAAHIIKGVPGFDD